MGMKGGGEIKRENEREGWGFFGVTSNTTSSNQPPFSPPFPNLQRRFFFSVLRYMCVCIILIYILDKNTRGTCTFD